MTRLSRALALAALGLVLACSREPGASTAAPAFSPLPAAPADERVWSLTQHFMNGGRTLPQEQTAFEEHVARCMREAGFEYEPVPANNSTFFNTIGELRRYRSTYGYGVAALPPEDGAAKAVGRRNGEYRDRLSDEERRRYDATIGEVQEDLPQTVVPPAGAPGCRARALREVRSGLPRTDPEIVRAVVGVDVSRDARYAAAVTTWSSCMRDRGYDFAHPDDPQRSVRDASGEVEERLRHEVALAVADVTCYVAHVHPAQASAERALLASLVKRFPAYARFLPPAT